MNLFVFRGGRSDHGDQPHHVTRVTQVLSLANLYYKMINENGHKVDPT